MLRDETDEALLERYQQGDTRAFELILARHRGGVFNFLRRHVRNEHAAEDLLQETFLRVVRSASSFSGKSKFSTWLYTIARNQAVDALRRGKHRKAQSLDTAQNEDAQPLEPADPRADVEREVGNRDLVRKLEDALAALPEDLREVFLMRERSGLAFKQIAQVVGCPENTAKSRMRYALERLRDALSEQGELKKVAT